MSVALIAGEGELPVEIARRLTDRGEPPLVYSLRERIGSLSKYALQIIPLARPELGAVLADFRERRVSRVLMAGVVPKTLIFQPAMLDGRARELVASLAARDDHSILGGLVALLERAGFPVSGYADLIPDLLAPSGGVAGREPSEEEREDVAYGVEVGRTLVSLSFGQTVVVSRRAVVAVEAMEGTDATLLRAGGLCRGGVVVKLMRLDQDDRFDLPTVGGKTLRTMARAGLRCLAVEAGRTIVLEPDSFRAAAEEEGIAVLGVEHR
jgi:DUF1009 family protein